MPPTAAPAERLLIAPGDPGYDALRAVHDVRIDRRPALIAACASAADVAAALALAGDRGLPVAVRGGGHSPAGLGVATGALVVDLRGQTQLAVDPGARTVVAGGGVTWGRLDAATQAHGLAVTGARVPGAGVAGTALNGGSGWLERVTGLTSDNLLAAEVVTADGRRVRASRSEHPDLFWALHGGGGNFGVVTALELALHPLPAAVPGGVARHPLADAERVLRHYRDVMAAAPDVLCGGALLGAGSVELVALWAGEAAAARPWLDRLGVPSRGTIAYTALQRRLDTPPRLRAAVRGGFMRALDDRAIAAAAALARRLPSSGATLLLQPLGGAFARFRHDTALGHRDAAWAFQALAAWPRPGGDAAHGDWVRAAAQSLATEPGGWPGFAAEAGAARPGEAYPETTFRRLARLKARWDPHNVLRHNHNIRPASG